MSARLVRPTSAQNIGRGARNVSLGTLILVACVIGITVFSCHVSDHSRVETDRESDQRFHAMESNGNHDYIR
jgi:hypothetical protein